MMDVMVGSLRGLGYSVMPMLVSLIGACGLRLLYLGTLFQLPQFHKAENLYLTNPVTWTITLLAHVVCFIIIRRRLERKWTQYGHVRYRQEANEAAWEVPDHHKK
jgi:Na+-driven multidrug efflux pump